VLCEYQGSNFSYTERIYFSFEEEEDLETAAAAGYQADKRVFKVRSVEAFKYWYIARPFKS
jgi:hypothetical protein